MNYYTGIGSRKTTPEVNQKLSHYANLLARAKYVLRSGAADGADTAFESGATLFLPEPGPREIYLPWKGFNAESEQRKFVPNDSPLFLDALPRIRQQNAEEIAKSLHPHWRELTIGGKKLHTRNVFQVLGKDLSTPSKFVICWTPDGKDSGGTGQAIRLARKVDAPVYNIFNPIEEALVEQLLETLNDKN